MQQKALALALSAIWAANTFAAEQTAENTNTLPEVKVSAKAEDSTAEASEKTKSYTVKSTETATRLNTSLRETPQSISVITRAQMDDFGLKTVNDVLDYATGVKVERVETDRTYYTARGADITNFQIDGVGMPFLNGNVWGDIDSAVYDRVEILRGANGLLSGTGNPSATINFVRKRPTQEFQARVDLSAGSWNNRRLDIDVSGPLNEAGNVRGRLVLATQDRDSYLDRYSVNKNVAYGIIEADVTDQTRVTVGHTYQQNNANSPMWGALPLVYADGTRRSYSRSASTAADWAYGNVLTNITFAELAHSFSNGWQGKLVLTRKESTVDTKLFYIFGNENTSTGSGLFGYPSKFDGTYKELLADAYASGPFTFAGREHELVVGSSWSRATADERSLFASYGGSRFIALDNFSSISTFPEPNFNGDVSGANFDIKRLNNYVAAKFNISDALKLTTGANMLSYESTGLNYGEQYNTNRSDKITPYLGAVYNLTNQHSIYASYTGIFNPQVVLNNNLQPLDPVEGKNYELGLKSEWLNKAVNTSVALFRSEQKNVAQQNADLVNGITTYSGIEANAKGYELDIAGEINDNLRVNGGFTNILSLEDGDNNNVKPYTPRRMVKLAAVYKIPQLEKLKVGASVNWQSDIHTDVNNVRVRQDSYAVVNLTANYEIDKHWSAALNLYNVTDEKYLTSLYWTQSYYAAPRSGMMTLTWKY
jgi:outer-membrane receptor for ferric coprogen and ferric-rhodotorulic acid